MSLPPFPFHPDPVRSGSIVASDQKCRCCGQKRGWIYSGPVYAEQDLEDALCPWCIADGKAHTKFDATFVDSEAFAADTPAAMIDEITTRTPGFATFQSERWPSCCGEPGAFVMPAGIADIRREFRAMEGELMSFIVYELGVSGRAAHTLLESLQRDRSPTAFVFQCRKYARPFGYVDTV